MSIALPLTLGFIGGTGPEGAGLALRFAHTGHPVAIGSRSLERAVSAAEAINQRLGGSLASPHDNRGAVLASAVVFVTVPYAAQRETLAALADAVGERVVVSTVAPLSVQKGRPFALTVPAGSAAQETQQLLPQARVTAAFHHLGAKHLADLEHPLEGDVLVCGDDAEAKQLTMSLAGELQALSARDAGGLEYACYVEAFTAVLLGMNRRYGIQGGIKITGF